MKLVCVYCRALFTGSTYQDKIVRSGDNNVWCSERCAEFTDLEQQNWIKIRRAHDAQKKEEL